jgi:hypothetical protein
MGDDDARIDFRLCQSHLGGDGGDSYETQIAKVHPFSLVRSGSNFAGVSPAILDATLAFSG